MPEITVISRDGESEVVQAELNQTLLEVIQSSGINELEAICGGCCSCATCHVYVDPEFVSKLPAVSEDEEMLLDGSMHFENDVSRLSCQIRITDAMDGLSVRFAPED